MLRLLAQLLQLFLRHVSKSPYGRVEQYQSRDEQDHEPHRKCYSQPCQLGDYSGDGKPD